MLKILYIFMQLLVFNIRVDSDHPTQAVTTRWLNELSKKFSKIYVITVHTGKINLPHNVFVYGLSSKGFDNKLIRAFRLYYFLVMLLYKESIDAVFVHQAVVSGALVGFIFKLLKIPILVWYSHRTITFWLKACHYWANGIISSSKDSFCLKSSKFKVTGHGIDTQVFKPNQHYPKTKNLFCIGYIGRYSPIKKIDVLVEAVRILILKNVTKLKVHLYGLCQNDVEAQYYRKILNDIKIKNLSKYFEFHKSVSNWEVPSLLHNFDIFVSQQETGGTDKAILEAMSSGLPVIMATTTFNTLLSDELTNKLIFTTDNAIEMAEKIEVMMSLTDRERKKIGIILRNIIIENHSLTNLSNEIYYIINEMTKGNEWLDKSGTSNRD